MKKRATLGTLLLFFEEKFYLAGLEIGKKYRETDYLQRSLDLFLEINEYITNYNSCT